MKRLFTGICTLALLGMVLTACGDKHDNHDGDRPGTEQRDEHHDEHGEHRGEHKTEPGGYPETHNSEHKSDTTSTDSTGTHEKHTEANRPGTVEQGKGIPTNVGTGHEKKPNTTM
jgi:hypothetical protein